MLEVARIIGGHRLSGTIQAAGAKNAALPLLAASLLTSEVVTLRNVPDLSDVRFMAEILRHQGATVTNPAPGTWVIHAQEINHRTPYDLVRKMRASVCLLGALVGRLHQAEMAIPGGCVIGPRPIDLHLKGLEALGCVVTVEGGVVSVDATRARGSLVFMGGPMGSTVLGTANLVMAASLTPGETRIECAAREPEVVDLCELLLKMGADIRGHGTEVITITGVERLRGTEHTVIPDRIETGTYLVAGAITGGDVTVTGAVYTDQEALDAFHLCGRLEGILPALETSHAVVEAMKIAAKRSKDDVVVVCFSGRGDKDCAEVARLTAK